MRETLETKLVCGTTAFTDSSKFSYVIISIDTQIEHVLRSMQI